jgi:hypothetical protein
MAPRVKADMPNISPHIALGFRRNKGEPVCIRNVVWAGYLLRDVYFSRNVQKYTISTFEDDFF